MPPATGIELSNSGFEARNNNCCIFIMLHCRMVQMATKELQGLELKEVSDVIIFSTETRLHVIRWYVLSHARGSCTHTK